MKQPADIAEMRTVRLGGDTDTIAAIAGGVIGAGMDSVPPELLSGIIEWPMTPRWLESLAGELARSAVRGGSAKAPRLPVYGRLIRNFLFLFIVLFHGFRRLLPPY